MESADRYAVYFAPPEDGRLARFAASWLGWDPAAGRPVDHPDAPPLDAADVARMTEAPRRYGFHGTLKAPFRLAAGSGYQDLRSALAGLADRLPPLRFPGLRLSRLGRFLALTPTGDQAPLAGLAERLTVDLDAFRAPLNGDELAKRRKSGLSPRQEGYLQDWGYPYVLEEFRFHLTLTGALSAEDGDRAEAALRPLVAEFEAAPFRIDSICIFADPGDGASFRIVERMALAG